MVTAATPWRYATLAFRIFLAIVFLVAGGSKVVQPWVFVHTVEGYNMLPNAIARPFGLALPWIEVLIGVYLLIGLFTRAAAAAAAVLLATFLVALSVQIARGHTGNCGCVIGLNNPIITAFVGGDTISAWDLIRDGLLLAMAVAIALTPRPWPAVDALLAARRAEVDQDEYETAPDPA